MNVASWPLVPLKKLLKQVRREVTLDTTTDYDLIGARWYAHGLYIKGRKSGADIKATKLYRVEEGDFVYNRLFAWKGSFAVASNKEHGCFVSNEFPCFEVDIKQLDPRFLWWYFSREKSWNESLGLSSGATPSSRNRLKEANLMAMKIPLPPLVEQRVIVEKIYKITSRIDELNSLRNDIISGQQQLLSGLFSKLLKDSIYIELGQVAPIVRRPVQIDFKNGIYPELGVRSFGKGTFHKPALFGANVGTKKIFRIEPGDLVFSNVFAWEGAMAIAQLEDKGRFGSHRFISCVAKDGVADALFLLFYFQTSEGFQKIQEASPGGAGRNRTLGLDALRKIKVPLPSFEKQLWFRGLCQHVDSMKRLQIETTAELVSMLPSILDKAFKGELIT